MIRDPLPRTIVKRRELAQTIRQGLDVYRRRVDADTSDELLPELLGAMLELMRLEGWAP